jgi:hypothetical protein
MRKTRPPHQRTVAKNPKIAHIAKPVSFAATRRIRND